MTSSCKMDSYSPTQLTSYQTSQSGSRFGGLSVYLNVNTSYYGNTGWYQQNGTQESMWVHFFWNYKWKSVNLNDTIKHCSIASFYYFCQYFTRKGRSRLSKWFHCSVTTFSESFMDVGVGSSNTPSIYFTNPPSKTPQNWRRIGPYEGWGSTSVAPIGRSKGVTRDVPHPPTYRSNFFHFHTVLAQTFSPSNRLAHTPLGLAYSFLGNPGSTTGSLNFSKECTYFLVDVHQWPAGR